MTCSSRRHELTRQKAKHRSSIISVMIRTLQAVAVVSVVLLAGCVKPVDGHADRTARTAAEEALPTSAELSQALGMQMRQDAAPRIGGPDILRDSARAAPQACSGVAHSGDRQTYHAAHLNAAAQGSWITSGDGDQTHVIITVTEFSSPQDIHTWYSGLTSDWQRCQGITVTEHQDTITFSDSIEHVENSAGMLNADLMLSTKEGYFSMPMPHGRALTTAERYGVDVEVLGRTRPGADTLAADTAATARLVADKLTSAA
ncbi:Hypothetical conserved lipoprotein LppR [Mycobacteroides abscessus subsp. abscessus]|nr:Hypothetical conserved lipoprotein LppR [Mycobacteroides abscessus subsp. abscessus]